MFTTKYIHYNLSDDFVSKNNIIIICLTLLYLFLFCSASGQLLVAADHKRYVVKTINIENGLQNNTVGDIITDTFGFTWVATKTGFQRYNGYRLETIQPTLNGQQQNIDYQVYFMQTNSQLLWITYKDGILQYNPFLNRFSRIIHSSSTSNCPLRPLEDTKEGVWCAEDKGLALYSHAGRRLKTFLFPDTTWSQSSASAGFHCTSNNEYIFLASLQNAVVLFNKQTHHFSLLPIDGVLANFTCRGNDLYVLHKNGITIYRQNAEGVFYPDNHFLQNNRFLGTIEAFQDGILASVDQHLLLLDSNCTKASEITTLNSQPVLPVGSMKTIYQDQFNRLWLITNNNVRVILNYNIPFQYFAYNNASNFSKSIYVDEQKGLVLAGFYDGGIQLYDTLNNLLWQQPLLTDKVKDVAGIEKLGDDEYLITTLSQGWFVLRLSQKKLTPVLVTDKEEAELHTHSIIWTNNIERIDSSNLIITTTSDVIQCRFNGNQIAWHKILFHDPNKQIYYFHFDKNTSRLWVGASAGLLMCKKPNGKTDTLFISGNYSIRCITTDAQSNVWAGTDKGLYVYDKNNKLINTFTTANGLLNDCIYSMLTDKDNKTIYASSNLGLSAVRPNGILKNYTKERGLQENEFNSAATAKTSSGKLYFGGVNGITAFYPSDITTEKDHPSLIIYKTDINDKSFASDSAVWNNNHFRLKHNESKISFSLTAFGIYPASDYTYEYRMENFDKFWTTTNNPVNISYHLPPGTYHFQARLANFPSLLISRDIVIASPFWDKWWFYTLLFLFVFAIILSTVRSLYQRRYKTQLQLLQIRQQVLAERERISRDLHDNIGAYASAISASVDDVIYQANMPNPVTLQRLKDSAREIIVQLRDSIWALNKENQTVIMLSDRIKNYVQKLQPVYPDITFDVDESIDNNTSFPSITALNVLRIVQEAVHNAIKHSQCSSIKINISSHSPVAISIEDNGNGMPDLPVYGEGVKNMQARAADIGWQVTIRNKEAGCFVLLESHHNTN